MPAKNSRKQYLENGYYHLYNRGVEKRIIFLDSQDYAVFLSYLRDYLMPKDIEKLRERLTEENLSYIEKDKILKLIRLNNFAQEIILLSYCLMPNHFHFFIKQKGLQSIDKFMNSLCTRYTMYFNRKYKRVGSLYQGVYKAVQVTSDAQFIYLSKYIHKQALALQGEALQEQPSSYKEYLGTRKTQWINTKEVLEYFAKVNSGKSYQYFVEESEEEGINILKIKLDD